MTNEEIATEIAKKVIIGYGPDHYDTALEAALKMAKYKDKQIKEAKASMTAQNSPENEKDTLQ